VLESIVSMIVGKYDFVKSFGEVLISVLGSVFFNSW